jgi:cyclopropane-fatty-acyl-phospholipid synthase
MVITRLAPWFMMSSGGRSNVSSRSESEVAMNPIMNSIIEKFWLQALSRLEYGTLEFVAPNGEVHIAKGRQPGPNARFAIHDWNVLRRVLVRGDLALGEDYVAGAWETDDVEKLVALFLLNMDALEKYSHGSFLSRMTTMIQDRFVRRNSLSGSKRNIAAHYDVGNDFYSLWLDKSMTYSSALFGDTAKDLEEAQQNKYQRILSKFREKRSSVLEIGCGWGGFAERAAQCGHRLTGITISPAQHRYACERLKGAADIR